MPKKIRQPGKNGKTSVVCVGYEDTYSEDYRLTPNCKLKVSPACEDSGCFGEHDSRSRRRSRCCSKERNHSGKRRFAQQSSPLCSRTPHLVGGVAALPVLHGHMRRITEKRMGAVVRKNRPPNSYEDSISCSSCDSCDSCFSSPDSSPYRIELPLEARRSTGTITSRSSSAASRIGPFRSVSLERNFQSKYEDRSPCRKRHSCAGDLASPRHRNPFRWPPQHYGIQQKTNARRTGSFAGYGFEKDFNELRARSRFRRMDDQKTQQNWSARRKDSMSASRSPTRRHRPNENSRTTTTTVTCIGGCRRTNQTHEDREDQRKGYGATIESEGIDYNHKQNNLLNKMVHQTREHRKQIKTLESELERLRTTGDVLASSEVNPSDVEWRPGDVVGEGSFSTVYKGAFCGTEVAVKELKCKLSQDDKNYFRSEAALLQQLHHPRIVLLMGVCTTSARPFMLLEYLSGGTLYSLIHRKPKERLDHASYFTIAKDVAQGMIYLHKHDPQVLHLDLKSMNVLLDNYVRAKIADFGFSILRRTRDSAAQKGCIRGTPAWMAPELLTRGEVSPKCDVYSFGIILWEMLTLSHPFHGYDIYHIMETTENGDRLPLPKTGISRELTELVTSCWAQNPSLRPSFDEILAALDTASLPVAWRKVIATANIDPSLLSNINAARAIYGMIERSADALEELSAEPRKKYKSDETEKQNRDKGKHRRQHKDSSLSVVSPTRERGLCPKTAKNLLHKAAKRNGFKESVMVDSNTTQDHDGFPSRKFCSDFEERGSPTRAGLSPRGRKVAMSRDGVKSPQSSKHRRSREERRSVNAASPTRGERRNARSERQLESSDKVSKRESQMARRKDRQRYSSSEGSGTERATPNESPSDRKRLQQRAMDRVNDRVNPADLNERGQRRRQMDVELRKDYDVIRGKRTPISSPDRRPKIRSLQRNAHRKYSAKVEGAEGVRGQSTHLPKSGGIVLTAEQLLNQKQRLRPVPPSALKDLSLLPQDSLNDISLLLKRAIRQRRDAVGQLQQSVKSGEINWSDWF